MQFAFTEEEELIRDSARKLATDRLAPLAETLDRTQARATRLDLVNRDVARRLDKAIETIRTVLSDDEAGR